MFKLLGYLVTNILVLYGVQAIIPEYFTVGTIFQAFGFIIILTLLNLTIVPIIEFFAIPINFLTLGLFNFILDLVVLVITANLVEGIDIRGDFWTQMFVALIITILFGIAHGIVNKITDQSYEKDQREI
jgi:putative membrane protein